MNLRAWNIRAVAIMVAFFVAYTGWTLLNRYMSDARWAHRHDSEEAARAAAFLKLYGGDDLRILQFYAREGSPTEGESTLLCYGVLNAKAVTLEPALEGVGPSLNRCLAIAPEKGTRYTLTAEGADGRTVSASLDVTPVADPAALPRITSFRVEGRTKDYLGRPLFKLSYTDENAEEVSIDPPVFSPMRRAPLGRFYVRPDRTTTYTLTVKGRFGHVATRQLTLQVPD
jgi:hypothetical protein